MNYCILTRTFWLESAYTDEDGVEVTESPWQRTRIISGLTDNHGHGRPQPKGENMTAINDYSSDTREFRAAVERYTNLNLDRVGADLLYEISQHMKVFSIDKRDIEVVKRWRKIYEQARGDQS